MALTSIAAGCQDEEHAQTSYEYTEIIIQTNQDDIDTLKVVTDNLGIHLIAYDQRLL